MYLNRISNLVLSIIGAKYIGLAGVYVGTVVSGVLANLIQPVIVYRDCFSKNVWSYFKDSLKYIVTILGILLVLIPINNLIMAQVNLFTFILMAAIITIIYNLVFFTIFRKTPEFDYLWELFAKKLPFMRKIRK